MSDTQFTALIATLASMAAVLGAAVRWSVNRIVKAIDASTAAHRSAETELAVQAEVLRNVQDEVRRVAEWTDAHTNVNDMPAGIRPKRIPTPARGQPIGGYSFKRPKTNVDD